MFKHSCVDSKSSTCRSEVRTLVCEAFFNLGASKIKVEVSYTFHTFSSVQIGISDLFIHLYIYLFYCSTM